MSRVLAVYMFRWSNKDLPSSRLIIAGVFCIGFSIILMMRAFHLQVLQYERFIDLALENISRAEKHQDELKSNIERLRQQYGDTLQGKLSDLDSLTLGEVRALVQDFTTFIELTEKERLELSFKTKKLQSEILAYKKDIKEYEKELSTIRGITESEREKLYQLFIKASEAKSREAFWQGVGASILIGILTSIVATILIRIHDAGTVTRWFRYFQSIMLKYFS